MTAPAAWFPERLRAGGFIGAAAFFRGVNHCYLARMTTHPIDNIRNFSIVAHIDHGKSTLADRLIQTCGGLAEREMVEQVLDSMDIERERGITIKAQTVRLDYKAKDGKTYILNLMDTPGHVDFAYEVSRSLAACEGSLLVVDASQGVEAQTLANVYQALDAGHEIVPVLNKIDLPAAEPDRIKQQIEDVIGLDAPTPCRFPPRPASASRCAGSHRHAPAAAGRENAPLKALLVDSWYDAYLGVVVLVRVIDGSLKKGQKIRDDGDRTPITTSTASASSVRRWRMSKLGPGEVGFITAQIKQVADTRVGDTITDDAENNAPTRCRLQAGAARRVLRPVPGRRADFEDLRAAMGKLRLNDASFSYEMEPPPRSASASAAGFLGLLHLEIIQERLHREFNLDLIATAPSVIYKIFMTNGDVMEMHNPVDMPDVVKIDDHRGAVDQGDDPDAGRLSGRGAEALPGPARRPGRSQPMSASAPWSPTTCRSTRSCSISTTG